MTTCVTRIDQKNEWQRESSLRALTVTSFSAHLQVKHLDVLCTMCTVHILPVSFYLYSMHLCKSFLFQPCHQLVQWVQLLSLSGCHKSTTLRGGKIISSCWYALSRNGVTEGSLKLEVELEEGLLDLFWLPAVADVGFSKLLLVFFVKAVFGFFFLLFLPTGVLTLRWSPWIFSVLTTFGWEIIQ